MIISWTEAAESDLYHATEFIAKNSVQAAVAVAQRIYDAVEFLADFPEMGRPGRWPNSRELVVSDLPFVIPYRGDGAEILILGIIHTSRSWPDDDAH